MACVRSAQRAWGDLHEVLMARVQSAWCAWGGALFCTRGPRCTQGAYCSQSSLARQPAAVRMHALPCNFPAAGGVLDAQSLCMHTSCFPARCTA